MAPNPPRRNSENQVLPLPRKDSSMQQWPYYRPFRRCKSADNLPSVQVTSQTSPKTEEVKVKQAHTFLHNRPRDFDLSLVSWNCRALNVAKIAKISSQADIICLQEVWNKTDIPGISALEPFKTTLRTDRRGGGSLTSYPQDFQISREFKINKDSTLIRFIVHGQRILWLANLYLNQGRITQIQKTFKVIQENIPPEEWASLIVIGDWNQY